MVLIDSLYQAEAGFLREGVAGLLPKPRGPKGAQKLNTQVMAFIEKRRPNDGAMHARALAQEIKSALGLSVHPRSIERALARKKNASTNRPGAAPGSTPSSDFVDSILNWN
ncbi:MAG: hypothetical protein ABIQ03_09590 [Burkholderiales bacterium]